MQKEVVGVIGAGAWGTALAIQMSKVLNVYLYAVEKDVFTEMIHIRTNQKALPGVSLPERVNVVNKIDNIILSQFIFIAVPSSAVLPVIDQLKSCNIDESIPIIICSKGLSCDGRLFSDILAEQLKNPILLLSGPNLAKEVAINNISIAMLACKDLPLALSLSKKFTTDTFIVTPTSQITLLQLAGCLKNVAASLSGMSNYLFDSRNTQALIFTKALQDIFSIYSFVKQKRNANYHSFTLDSINAGVIGDLVACCYSDKSRNYAFGYQLSGIGAHKRREFIDKYPVLIESKANVNKVVALQKLVSMQSYTIANLLDDIIKCPHDLENLIKAFLFTSTPTHCS